MKPASPGNGGVLFSLVWGSLLNLDQEAASAGCRTAGCTTDSSKEKMTDILIIGAGGVGRAALYKCLGLPEYFREICLASRSLAACEAIRAETGRGEVRVARVDASCRQDLVGLLRQCQPRVVLNAALPRHNLPVMEACLEAGCHYVDTSAPEPDAEGYELFSYRHQLALADGFRRRSIAGLLSFGFAPGVTNIFCAYAAKHLFDEIHSVDILDCNGGDHGRPFATNFSSVVNIQEVLQPAVYWQNGLWRQVPAFSTHRRFSFDGIGSRRMYLIYHEELETLAARLRGLRCMRFWMHFSRPYLEHLEVLHNMGLTSMKPVNFQGLPVRPLQLLGRLLPPAAELAGNYRGRTNIGCLFHGRRQGREKTVHIYNVCDHQACYRETRSHAVSYTTAVPAVLAASLLLGGQVAAPGLYLPEDLDPDVMMGLLPRHGLPWKTSGEAAWAAADGAVPPAAGEPGKAAGKQGVSQEAR